jgi:hypothetical protein
MIAGLCSAAPLQPLPSAEEVVQKLVQRAEKARSGEHANSELYYLCTKKTVTEEMDTRGQVTDREVKVRERKRPSSGAMDARKWTAENGVSLDAELLRRYEFTVEKREVLNGRPTLVLTFSPRNPPAPVRKLQDYLLNRTKGTVWVDEAEYELAKAEIALGEPVSFGILGAVHAFSFSFQRGRADDGSWLNLWTDTTVKARKFLRPVRTRKRVDWTGFQKLDRPR